MRFKFAAAGQSDPAEKAISCVPVAAKPIGAEGRPISADKAIGDVPSRPDTQKNKAARQTSHRAGKLRERFVQSIQGGSDNHG